MNLYIDLNNNLKLLNIQKNISCFSLKNIIINKYSLKYDFSIIYKNKILENNDLINSNKDIYKIKYKLNGGNKTPLNAPANFIAITAFLTFIFLLMSYLTYRSFLYDLTISSAKDLLIKLDEDWKKNNSETNNDGINIGNTNNKSPYSELLQKYSTIKVSETDNINNKFLNMNEVFKVNNSKYTNSNILFQDNKTCLNDFNDGNGKKWLFSTIADDDDSRINKMTMVTITIFYFISFFSLALSFITLSQCKRPNGFALTLIIILCILFFFIPYILKGLIVKAPKLINKLFDNIVINFIKNICKKIYRFFKNLILKTKGEGIKYEDLTIDCEIGNGEQKLLIAQFKKGCLAEFKKKFEKIKEAKIESSLKKIKSILNSEITKNDLIYNKINLNKINKNDNNIKKSKVDAILKKLDITNLTNLSNEINKFSIHNNENKNKIDESLKNIDKDDKSNTIIKQIQNLCYKNRDTKILFNNFKKKINELIKKINNISFENYTLFTGCIIMIVIIVVFSIVLLSKKYLTPFILILGIVLGAFIWFVLKNEKVMELIDLITLKICEIVRPNFKINKSCKSSYKLYSFFYGIMNMILIGTVTYFLVIIFYLQQINTVCPIT